MSMKRAETEIVLVLEFEENEVRPEVPPEQEEVSATEEEENRLSDNRTNTDTENGSSSEEPLIILASRACVGRAPARLCDAPAEKRGRGQAGRARIRGGCVAAARARRRGCTNGTRGRGRPV